MINGHNNVIVSCLYRTPGYNTNDFSEILYDLYSELSVSKTIFICGDRRVDTGCRQTLPFVYKFYNFS